MVDRIEPEVTGKYKKDPVQEEFLARLNSILEPFQEEDYQKDLPELYPTIHVVGVPRSGTTLVTQLLAAHTDLGYINNLIAAFWKAPVYGIRLSKHLVDSQRTSSYQSEFGRTKGINEPHEFGYFWTSLLNYRQMLEPEDDKQIDWQRLRLILTNMTHAYGNAIFFKSFLLGWHMCQMQEILPRTCWIHIKRDPIQNALSILDFRLKFLGSKERWVSLKPKEYHWLKDRPYWEQVAGQVYFLEKRLQAQLKHIPEHNKLSISYEELCARPEILFEKLADILNRQNLSFSKIGQIPSSFVRQDKKDLEQSSEAKHVISAWEEFNRKFGEIVQ